MIPSSFLDKMHIYSYRRLFLNVFWEGKKCGVAVQRKNGKKRKKRKKSGKIVSKKKGKKGK